ncbi:UDP-N-acetylmuramoyl-L-alanyl-D-glutamate--2,6-diaminopimelate ligase [Nanchangia anserum]|uniref:UDP-N-acetylmuramyl-tripeptide synthetase n=1 Tax=Nanchangia anserum TaxID=2692125 RepID=A0A8I0G748_9ACTO|nr:UDP-N-acetylmuramoyl-L-alanyl-D-glutamate--2,6-diaminopimelate ligase [Nanchangia anserum]MBD3689042.1 UDP-N-acetylmuramoyl-L-alanyl-D-glutamate--2,6-diaminopimelate ligase [Nanchangia anserum]QOX81286.1 UDP-N-acetylmuramoyl-L-alanyl-D-glutamate--2,6-diaminopimelate ligase [Nanchangia anserum]
MSVTLSDLRPRENAGTSVSEIADLVGATCERAAQVSGVSVDSNDIAPGDLFIAVPGAATHGASFARLAVERGAVAVLTDAAGARQVCRECPDVPVIVVDDPRHVEGEVAARVYGDPSAAMPVLGVTGTNGKTTTAYLLHAIIQGQGVPALLQGTGVQKVGDDSVYTVRTTAEAPVLHRLMALARERGLAGAVLEISAHAVSLERINAIHFDAVGFTNLQHDHLDYYGDMEHYYRAKAGLFAPEHARVGVVCVDDEWGRRLAGEAEIPVVTVSTAGEDADWQVADARVDSRTGGTCFTLRGEGSDWGLSCPLPGDVNVQNSAVAALVARQAGIDPDQIARALAGAPQVPGRMEAIGSDSPDDPLVIVDYAHTPEALDAVLETARGLSSGKLHVVFGTDGDRDATKRPDVGRAAARGADVLWVTDENPRTEPAHVMRSQLLEGICDERPSLEGVTVVETSRRDAIREAIMAAAADDTVIITGKGAEAYQEINYCFHPFSDQAVARECLEGRAHRRALTARLDQ